MKEKLARLLAYDKRITREYAEWLVGRATIAKLMADGELTVSPFTGYIEIAREKEDFFP